SLCQMRLKPRPFSHATRDFPFAPADRKINNFNELLERVNWTYPQAGININGLKDRGKSNFCFSSAHQRTEAQLFGSACSTFPPLGVPIQSPLSLTRLHTASLKPLSTHKVCSFLRPPR